MSVTIDQQRIEALEVWQRKHDIMCAQQHAEIRTSLKVQNTTRAMYGLVTLMFVYANGIHAPKWLFQLLNGMLQ